MQYVNLGSSTMKVSKVALGTMTFGKMNTEKEAFAIMDRARELGITYFDTANNYGGGVGLRGRVEQMMNRWFQEGDKRRESVILASKFGLEVEEEADGVNDAMGLSAYKMRRSLERSLKRLGTDRLELYTMHHEDRQANWDEIWGAYENLIAQGKIYYAGSSNFSAWELCRAKFEAEKRHFLGMVVEQHKYNLFCRLPELEMFPASRALGIGISAYNPLCGGYLTENALNPRPGTRAAGDNIYSKTMGVYNEGPYREQLVRFDKLCKEAGLLQSDVAMAWVCHNPYVNVVIIGPRTVEQLERSVRAAELKLDDDFLRALDEIFPGPGGEAPKAYMRF